jgi:hypothetical protein
MNRLQNNVLMLFIGIAILLVSGNSFINLSTITIDSDLQALWTVFAISLTIMGLLISPVLIMMSLGSMVKHVLHPSRKQKQKNVA